jgi:hypothetical protein
MDTMKYPLYLFGVLLITGASVSGQDTPVVDPGKIPEMSALGDRGENSSGRDSRIEMLPLHLRQKVNAMAPADRDRFLKNMQRWTELSPEERKRVKDVGNRQVKRMRDDMDRLADSLGLARESEARKEFEARYREERRDLERGILEQMRAIRKPLLDAMNASLKEEFLGKAKATPSP